jgi:hypothetical protein
MYRHFNPAQHKHVRYSLGLISVTIVCHGTEKMRNENGRMLKKVLYFDICFIFFLFVKPLVSKNLCYHD